MTHSEKQGWIRTILTIGSVVVSITGAIYYLRAEVESHINNKEIHLTFKDVNTHFVSRSEYESGLRRIEDDLKYVRGRLDAIAELILQKRREDNMFSMTKDAFATTNPNGRTKKFYVKASGETLSKDF